MKEEDRARACQVLAGHLYEQHVIEEDDKDAYAWDDLPQSARCAWIREAENHAPAIAAMLAFATPSPVIETEGSGEDPVIIIEVESAHDRHTYIFRSRPESEAFLAGARKFPGIAVTAIEERHVATAEYALGGLPEMLEAQADD